MSKHDKKTREIMDFKSDPTPRRFWEIGGKPTHPNRILETRISSSIHSSIMLGDYETASKTSKQTI